MNKATQNQRVIDYMTQFGGITQIQALSDLGVMEVGFENIGPSLQRIRHQERNDYRSQQVRGRVPCCEIQYEIRRFKNGRT